VDCLRRPSFAIFVSVLAVLCFATVAAANASQTPAQAPQDQRVARARDNLIRRVRHKLAMLPYYSVYDYMTFEVDGDHVTLNGATVRDTLKSDAEKSVKSIEGVASVTNNVEILPLSSLDWQVRRAVSRAIYREPALSRYGLSSMPSIHILVRNGNVTLEGVVDREADKNLAGIRANGVPGVFGVKNNLVVAKP
jgi:hyperosmotically inducible protein